MCYLPFSCGRCQQTCGPKLGQRERQWVNIALWLCHSVSSYIPPILQQAFCVVSGTHGPQNQWAPGSQIPRWNETRSLYCPQPFGPHIVRSFFSLHHSTNKTSEDSHTCHRSQKDTSILQNVSYMRDLFQTFKLRLRGQVLRHRSAVECVSTTNEVRFDPQYQIQVRNGGSCL